jgi:putative ABC transport system permease protein
VQTFADDLRHARRRLTGQRGTAVVAGGMLALAIGITSAMLTIVDHMLLRPVPYRDPSALVSLYVGTGPHEMLPYVTRNVVRAWRESAAFTAVAAVAQQPVILEGQNGLVIKGAVWISPGALEMLGVSPLAGRTFLDGEGRPGSEDRVIISESVWRGEYAGDPAIVGRRIRLSGTPVTIVGVMPRAFHFPYWRTEVWRPYDLATPPPAAANNPLMAYARLHPGVPVFDAARLATAAATTRMTFETGGHVMLRGLTAGFLDDYSRTALTALAGGIALVFVVLCANVTNLILARATGRRQEFGVCSALGASRGRLVRQALIESGLITVAATLAGLFVAWSLINAARTILPEDLFARTLNPVEMDARAIVATVFLGVVALLAAGLPPAWIGTAINPADSLRGMARGGTSTRAARSWTTSLLVAEVALATALLVGAGVLVASFVNLLRLDPGLDVHHVVTASVTLPDFAFRTRDSRAAFARELERQMAQLPGVDRVALSSGLPPESGGNTSDPVQTDTKGAAPRRMNVLFSAVEPDFFQVYGIRILEGRGLQASDAHDQAIVSEKLAKTLWPNESALGHSFTFQGWSESYRVVGVSHEVRSTTALDPLDDLPEFYTPMILGGRQIGVGLRCDAACPGEATIRERVRTANPQAMVFSVQPLAAAYAEQLARPRAASVLGFTFAAVSLVAASTGLFSVLSYTVARRRREFGIRLAMGAQASQIRRLVLVDAIKVAAVGLSLGAGLAWLLSQAIVTLAFGVTAGSPLLWATTLAVVGGATLVAAWRPAVIAMRVDPLVLLADE